MNPWQIVVELQEELRLERAVSVGVLLACNVLWGGALVFKVRYQLALEKAHRLMLAEHRRFRKRAGEYTLKLEKALTSGVRHKPYPTPPPMPER